MNWLGDSEPNFPAQISEILYAQFYATPVKGTRFGIFVFGEFPRWRHRIVAIRCSVVVLRVHAARMQALIRVFTRFLYGPRCLGTGSPFSKHSPN
jgi:hypothetical protein